MISNDDFTPKKIIQNPIGSGTAAGMPRYLSKNLMKVLYQSLHSIKKGKIALDINKNRGYVHLKIPSQLGSETPDYLPQADLIDFLSKIDMHYDVVISFDMSSSNFEENQIKIFSNSPAFQFTYTYVLNDNDLLILKDKCFDEALTDAPRVKNPDETWGFEKTIYFALMYLKENKFLTKKSNLYYLIERSKNKLSDIEKDVMHAEDKLEQYAIANKKFSKFKKDVKKKLDKKKKTWEEENPKKSTKSPKTNSSRNQVKLAKSSKLAKNTKVK